MSRYLLCLVRDVEARSCTVVGASMGIHTYYSLGALQRFTDTDGSTKKGQLVCTCLFACQSFPGILVKLVLKITLLND
jgi:hypothetical protein